MVSRLGGFGLLAAWAVAMIALSYFVYQRQGVSDTSEFITAGGRAQV